VATPPAEAMLDHGGARSGARAEFDNHRLTALGYRHAQHRRHRGRTRHHCRDSPGIADELAQKRGVHRRSYFANFLRDGLTKLTHLTDLLKALG
jgi:hypothetical protein